MKRILLSLVLAVGIPGASLLGGLPAAHAENCGLTDIFVTVHETEHHYDYWSGCESYTPAYHDTHIVADWDPSTKQARQVEFTGINFYTTWSCPSDPWDVDYGAVPECSLVGGKTRYPGQKIAPTYLTDDERHVFHAQLQNALNQAAAESTVNHAPERAVLQRCAPCFEAPSAPIDPNLAVTDVRPEGSQTLSAGMSAVYDIVVANTGAKLSGGTQVQVLIQVTGAIQYLDIVRTPAGFSCSAGTPTTCVGPLGGYGDAPITTVATFGVRVHATAAGLGAISAAVDPNDLIHESNESDNAKTLPVTVK